MSTNPQNNKEKLLDSMDLDTLATNFKVKMQAVNNFFEELCEFEKKLGTKEDTKELRGKMKTQTDKTHEEIKLILEIINQIEGLTPKKKAEKDKRDKFLKQYLAEFNRTKDLFIKILKKIDAKEKTKVELMKSTSNIQRDPIANNEAVYDQIVVEEINYVEDEINQRQENIDKIKNIIGLMNEISKEQAKQVVAQGEQLDVVVENIEKTKENVDKTNDDLDVAYKYEKSSSRKNLYICLLISLVALVIIGGVIYKAVD